MNKIIENIGWLLIGQIFRLSVGLVVLIWLARYLGPSQFGLYNYAVAFAAVFGALSSLGLDTILVRELVKHPEKTDVLLGSAIWLKLAGSLSCFFISMVIISFIRPHDALTLCLVGIVSAGFFFQSINVIDLYFQSKVQSKYTVIATNGAFLIISLIKLCLIWGRASLIAFAIAGLAETILCGAFLIIAFRSNNLLIRNWRFSCKTARTLLADSWPLVLSSVAIMIYMRIDQVMIGQMLGDKEVGIYAAAVRVCEAWYFIPAVIVSSVFPAIIDAKNKQNGLYRKKLKKLYTLVIWIGIAFALAITIVRSWLVTIVYGPAYEKAAEVLAVYVWNGILAGLSVAGGRWYIIENFTILAFKRNVYGAIINIILNIYFIKEFGIVGAAVATVLSYATASFVMDYFNPLTREQFYLKLKAVFFLP